MVISNSATGVIGIAVGRRGGNGDGVMVGVGVFVGVGVYVGGGVGVNVGVHVGTFVNVAVGEGGIGVAVCVGGIALQVGVTTT